MLVSSRRSLILGLGSLIVAPALVKASSLMPLRGYDMDPWVIGYQHYTNGTKCYTNGAKFSVFNKLNTPPNGITYGEWKALTIIERVKHLNRFDGIADRWFLTRKSETYVVGS